MRPLASKLTVALSVLGIVVVAGVWGWSYLVGDAIRYSAGRHYGILESYSGRLLVGFGMQNAAILPSGVSGWRWRNTQPFSTDAPSTGPGEKGSQWNVQCAAFSTSGTRGSTVTIKTGAGGSATYVCGPEYLVGVPDWFLLATLSMALAMAIRTLRRTARKQRVGLCRSCGYDLRATPRCCPECGCVPAIAE